MLTTSERAATVTSLKKRNGLLSLAWNVVAAASVALIACLTLLGRADLLRPSLAWALLFVLVSCAAAAWMIAFTSRLTAAQTAGSDRTLQTTVALHGPLMVLSLAASAGIYLSDSLNHQVVNFLQPTAPVLVVLAAMATAVAQGAVLRRVACPGLSVADAIAASQRWAIPLSLALLGLIQGASYLWVIGDDFTRYWFIADAFRSWSGYPSIVNLPNYIMAGEPRYISDLPGFSLILLPSFAIFGHDTLGALIPNLLANMMLPVLIYAFCRRASISSPIAFIGTCALIVQPFFRLYTLNAPVPDATFLAILVGTGIAFQSVISHRHSTIRWLVFGFLAGYMTFTRPEGPVYLGVFALALLPYIRQRGPYLAAAAFLVPILPFVAVVYSSFGYPWPNNVGSIFGLGHVDQNLYWLQNKTLRWYADAFQLSIQQFLVLLALLTLWIVAGVLLLARRQWKLAVLPLAGLIEAIGTLAVDPTVSGVHLWFDLFRHISYGLPFMLVAMLVPIEELLKWAGARPRRHGNLRSLLPRTAVVVLLGISLFQINMLAHPSQTYGSGSPQLLTSDIWVSFQDVVAHRYTLPQIRYARDANGRVVIDPEFDRSYMSHHLDNVNRFYAPYSAIRVNKGSEYEVASVLALLFGSFFAALLGREKAPSSEEMT